MLHLKKLLGESDELENYIFELNQVVAKVFRIKKLVATCWQRPEAQAEACGLA